MKHYKNKYNIELEDIQYKKDKIIALLLEPSKIKKKKESKKINK